MKQKKLLASASLALAVGAGSVALVAAPAAASSAAGSPTTVTVRIEGVKRELLAPRTVRTHRGWITRFGAPRGRCPATSAIGALDVATHHNWRAQWSSSYVEYFLTAILGQTADGPGATGPYWNIWVDDRYAQVGVCGLKLHRGEQLLFAAYPGIEYPIGLRAPGSVRPGRVFEVRVVWFTAAGKAMPLAGARVDGARTDRRGIAKITPRRAGILVLRATKAGYIRSPAVRVAVS